jgi:UDP-N-acetylglucosamine 2-epimerase (non-hydrolysing)
MSLLRRSPSIEVHFIWSGQHYSHNLKDIFFKELDVAPPSLELGARGDSDSELVSSIIKKLYLALEKIRPAAAVFLGDTNTVMGSIAAAQLNIPIIHIEGCMRSYDWRMPEEKYRIIVDHLSDVIYAYLDEYKRQGINEGLNPNSIIVTGNPIVDVLRKYYSSRRQHYALRADRKFFAARRLEKQGYFLMTCHRRENLQDARALKNIMSLVESTRETVYFPASYRTQRTMQVLRMKPPSNLRIVDPIGYEEFLTLLTNSRGVLSDSGTVVEEACILGVPCVQMRRSTERPQVYDVGACAKFDPTEPDNYPCDTVVNKLQSLRTRKWRNPFGDGKASQRIAANIIEQVQEGTIERHRPSDYHLNIDRSFRDDSL